jgi:hypothetical protein
MEVTPVINDVLLGLIDAEGPRLRRKAMELITPSTENLSDKSIDAVSVPSTIEQRLWKLVQGRIKPPSVTLSRSLGKHKSPTSRHVDAILNTLVERPAGRFEHVPKETSIEFDDIGIAADLAPGISTYQDVDTFSNPVLGDLEWEWSENDNSSLESVNSQDGTTASPYHHGANIDLRSVYKIDAHSQELENNQLQSPLIREWQSEFELSEAAVGGAHIQTIYSPLY